MQSSGRVAARVREKRGRSLARSTRGIVREAVVVLALTRPFNAPAAVAAPPAAVDFAISISKR